MTAQAEIDLPGLNDLINHPEIRCWMPGEGNIDLAQFLGGRACIVFKRRHGAMLFRASGNNVWDVHIMFRRPARGSDASALAKSALAEMFEVHGAVRIDALTLQHNIPARRLALQMGFQRTGKVTRQVGGIIYPLVGFTLTEAAFRSRNA